MTTNHETNPPVPKRERPQQSSPEAQARISSNDLKDLASGSVVDEAAIRHEGPPAEETEDERAKVAEFRELTGASETESRSAYMYATIQRKDHPSEPSPSSNKKTPAGG
jgi:hypothetical protein